MITLKDIRIDGGTQPRMSINEHIVAEYADAMRAGVVFPPLTVFFDGADYWLADGFHRYHALKASGATVDIDSRSGTRRDAVLFSVGANDSHGLRRTNEDKRKAVQTLLADSEWAAWSDRKIADACAVSHPFVAALRPRSLETVSSEKSGAARKVTTKHGTETTMKTAGIAASNHQRTAAPDHQDKPAKKAKRELPAAPAADADYEVDNLRATVQALSERNDDLEARVAVESMDASEDEKTAAAALIAELRSRVKSLEAEIDALRSTRNAMLTESDELKKSVAYWRRQAEKAAA